MPGQALVALAEHVDGEAAGALHERERAAPSGRSRRGRAAGRATASRRRWPSCRRPGAVITATPVGKRRTRRGSGWGRVRASARHSELVSDLPPHATPRPASSPSRASLALVRLRPRTRSRCPSATRDAHRRGALQRALRRVPHARRGRHARARRRTSARASATTARTSTSAQETIEQRALRDPQRRLLRRDHAPEHRRRAATRDDVAKFVAKYAGTKAGRRAAPRQAGTRPRGPPRARPQADPPRPGRRARGARAPRRRRRPSASTACSSSTRAGASCDPGPRGAARRAERRLQGLAAARRARARSARRSPMRRLRARSSALSDEARAAEARARRGARRAARTCPPPTPPTQDTVLREVGEAGEDRASDHLELAGERIDMERGARLSGSRFAYLRGELVLLELALVRWALHVLARTASSRSSRRCSCASRRSSGPASCPTPSSRSTACPRTSSTSSAPREVALASLHAGEILDEVAAAALRRLLAVLPARGGRRGQGHARDLPRAPVRQGRDVLVRRARGLGGRARAHARASRRGSCRRSRSPTASWPSPSTTSAPRAAQEVRPRGLAARPGALPRADVVLEHDRLPGAAAGHPPSRPRTAGKPAHAAHAQRHRGRRRAARSSRCSRTASRTTALSLCRRSCARAARRRRCGYHRRDENRARDTDHARATRTCRSRRRTRATARPRSTISRSASRPSSIPRTRRCPGCPSASRPRPTDPHQHPRARSRVARGRRPPRRQSAGLVALVAFAARSAPMAEPVQQQDLQRARDGMAPSAPSTPASCDPTRMATSTTSGESCTVRP